MTTTAHTPPVAGTCTPAQRVTKSLLGYGVLAGTVFEASVIVDGLTRHGFRIAHDDASLLSNGPLGWIQIATFLLAGAMAIAAAAGGAVDGGAEAFEDVAPVHVEQRHVDPSEQIGRNDPCWCGSGKKYKRCHGA